MTDDPTRQIETPPAEATGTEASVVAPAGGTAPPSGGDGTLTPVAATVSPGGGANRARWAIGLGVAGLAIAAVIAAVLVLGSRPTPPALTYIPAGAVMVIEVRPDLPGDQLQKLGNLLAHFPGFADQSTLPDKLDETFAQLFGQGSGGSVDYRADIKPWLSGPAFVALLPPSGATAENPMSFFHGVASLTTTGTVACDALLVDQAVTHEAYRDLDLVLGPGGAAACVVTGTQALLGDPQSVRAAIDAHADGSGLDRSATYQEARASLQGDQLQTLFLSGTGYLDMLDEMMELTPGMSGTTACFPAASFPAWMAQGLRAEDDAIVFDAVVEAAPVASAGATPGPSLLPIPPAHQSAILPFVPANTIVLFESQGIGVNLQNTIAQLSSCPMYGPALDMLDQAGNPADLLAWIDDIGLIVINGEGGVTGGLVVVAKDAAAATERVATLKGLLTLAELGGSGIETSESTIGGVTVTTVTVSDLGSLVPPGQLPPGIVPPDGTIEFSIAMKDRVILLGAGAGDSFMTAALTVQPGAGLVDQAGYKAATARALPNSQATVYVAIRDIVGIVEPLIPAEARAKWDEYKPYIAPFQALSMTSSADATASGRSRLTITISNP